MRKLKRTIILLMLGTFLALVAGACDDECDDNSDCDDCQYCGKQGMKKVCKDLYC